MACVLSDQTGASAQRKELLLNSLILYAMLLNLDKVILEKVS